MGHWEVFVCPAFGPRLQTSDLNHHRLATRIKHPVTEPHGTACCIPAALLCLAALDHQAEPQPAHHLTAQRLCRRGPGQSICLVVWGKHGKVAEHSAASRRAPCK
jgi:hypothetical protein